MRGPPLAVWPLGSQEARQGWTFQDRLKHAGLPLLCLRPGQAYFADSAILESETSGRCTCMHMYVHAHVLRHD